MCVCNVYMYKSESEGVHMNVEVKGQLPGACSLLPVWFLWLDSGSVGTQLLFCAEPSQFLMFIIFTVCLCVLVQIFIAMKRNSDHNNSCEENN